LISPARALYKTLIMSVRQPAFLGADREGGQAVRQRPDAERGSERDQAGPPGHESNPYGRQVPRPRSAREPVPRGSRTAAPTFYVAGFWRRLAAGLIDLTVLAPVLVLLTWLAAIITGIQLPAANHRGLDFWLDMFLAGEPALVGGVGLALAIALIYLFLFQATTGRTLGMRVLRVRVIDLFGDPPSMLRTAARTAAYLASIATLGLGFFWIGFDSEKRGLHDWLAGTYVVVAEART
jgi:uncharacterized RDD family membrane protein YckC